MSAFEIVNWGEVILWPTSGAVCLALAIKGKGGVLPDRFGYSRQLLLSLEHRIISSCKPGRGGNRWACYY